MANGSETAARRVPEAAVVVAVLLVGSLFVFLLAVSPERFLDPAFSASVLGAAIALAYPFLAYAVVFDDDPTTVFVPRGVAALGIVLGVLAGLLGTLGGVPWTPLLVLAALVPPLAYALVYGGSTPPVPERVLLGGVAAVIGAFALATAEGVVGLPAAFGSGALLGLLAGAYDRWRGSRRRLDDPALLGVILATLALLVGGWLLGGTPGATTVLLVAVPAVLAAVIGQVAVHRRLEPRSRRRQP